MHGESDEVLRGCLCLLRALETELGGDYNDFMHERRRKRYINECIQVLYLAGIIQLTPAARSSHQNP